MVSPRRVGAETSKTRQELLDAVERLMLDEGYAAVTYRAVAGSAGVTPGLVQYYFPTLDDVFIAAVRRRSEQNLERLRTALRERPTEVLRVLWEYGRDEATAALTSEFMALGHHRPSIRAVLTEVTEQVRSVQLTALADAGFDRDVRLAVPPEVLAFLLTGVPKLMGLERGIGVTTSHAETVAAFEAHLGKRPARR